MVVKDRYTSMFIPKYQKSWIAVISVSKNVLSNVVTILDNFVLSKVRNSAPLLSCTV